MSELTPKPLSGLADPLAPVRYLDVILVLLAAPFVVLLDGPVLGYAVGAGVWLLQRVIELKLDRAGRRSDAKREVGLKFASMMARTWLVGLAIVVVGLAGEREDGFTAAVLCLVAYTVHLATALMLRSLEGTPNRT
jgi:L-asparagine transporter-like permease